MPLICCLVDPGEMIDAQHIDLNFTSGRYLDFQVLRCNAGKHALGGEDFMTASEDLEFGCDTG